MRKLIVKYFALDYKCELFGTTITFVRAANVIAPVFFLNGILSIANENGPRTVMEMIALALLAIVLFLGFVYFRIKPVKFNELDESQKYQYGQAISSGMLTEDVKMSPSELAEWNKIDKKFKVSRPKHLLAFLVNPICLVLFLLAYIFVI